MFQRKLKVCGRSHFQENKKLAFDTQNPAFSPQISKAIKGKNENEKKQTQRELIHLESHFKPFNGRNDGIRPLFIDLWDREWILTSRRP